MSTNSNYISTIPTNSITKNNIITNLVFARTIKYKNIKSDSQRIVSSRPLQNLVLAYYVRTTISSV